MIVEIIYNYLQANKRLVVPNLGAFIVKQSADGGRKVLFSPLFKTDDGVLRKLLIEKGVNELEAAGEERSSAVMTVVRRFINEAKDIMFEGNGYSKEWEAEAERRGLRAVRNVPEAYEVYHEPQTVELFDKLGVLAPNEVEARFGILNETYVKKLQIEARVMGDMCLNHVIPAAVKYQNILIENVKGMKDIFGEGYHELCSSEIETLKKISNYINSVSADVDALVNARKKANVIEDIALRAKIYSHEVKGMMDKVRDSVDNLEMLIDDEMWPLPKYRELLFI